MSSTSSWTCRDVEINFTTEALVSYSHLLLHPGLHSLTQLIQLIGDSKLVLLSPNSNFILKAAVMVLSVHAKKCLKCGNMFSIFF